MRLLIVAATEFELLPATRQHIAADFLITGVGSPACMYRLTKALQHKKYDFAIQAGIAGSFSDELAPGATVVVKKDVFAELGVLENKVFRTLFETNLAKPADQPYTNGWLMNASSFMNKAGLRTVTAVTVNTIADNTVNGISYVEKFQADIESMEGAAFHYCCLMEKIPFLQVRAISNVVGERDKTRWKLEQSISNLNNQLPLLVNKILQYF